MKECDLASWVEQKDDGTPPLFRKAVHLIINAIAKDKKLSDKMVIKGGILLSIQYNSSRFTKDIDFSTNIKRTDFDPDAFVSEFNNALSISSEESGYGLLCKVQSHKFQPPREDATFPTLKIKVGYTQKGTPAHRKLLKGSPVNTVIPIDYSLNEITCRIEKIIILGSGSLSAYSIADIVAEKLRAVLQQKSRNRSRRQDIYDLNLLLENYEHLLDKKEVLDTLLIKSQARGLEIDRHSITDEDIIARSKKNYHLLEDEILGDLPDFDEIYKMAQRFYESLPWKE